MAVPTSVVFIAVLPKSINYGDVIVLHGKLKADATKFSINLCGESSKQTILHFRTELAADSNKVFHACNGGKETVEENTWVGQAGSKFDIHLLLSDGGIHICKVNDSNVLYQIEKFDISETKTLQVWDDVEYIEKCTFQYKTAE